MRKEVLLRKKEEMVSKMVWYAKNELLGSKMLKAFSLAQLEILKTVLDNAEKHREHNETFHGLSVNEVVHCKTGKIIRVDDEGNICEVTENEIKHSASRGVYESYKNRGEIG